MRLKGEQPHRAVCPKGEQSALCVPKGSSVTLAVRPKGEQSGLCVLCVPVLAGERHGRTGHRDPDQGAEGDVTGDFNHHLHTTTELFDQFITLCRSQDSMR